MNSIQLANRIDLYCDVTRNARYQRLEYDNAINDATRIIIDSILNPDAKGTTGFQRDQYTTDDLYSLQKTQTAALSTLIATYPADYYFATSLFATIGGTQYFCRPTTYDKLGPLLNDSYRAPSATKPYYLQVLTGFKIYSGVGTVTSADLNYIKTPAVVTIGKDSQLIAPAGTLTNALVYYAIEPSVYATVNYNIGDSITGTGAALTSGGVILSTNTTSSDLPPKLHEALAKISAEILTGVVQGYSQSAFAEKEAQKS